MYYEHFLKKHNTILDANGITTISSFDLFIQEKGIECAIRPYLYPTKEFTDTDIKDAYQTESGDYSKRVPSTGLSVTRKACSSVRPYAEDPKLIFFLHEKQMAQKYFNAPKKSTRYGSHRRCHGA